MSQKSARIASLIESFRGGPYDARYLAYFDCFNRQLFYEAHEVLEDLWLPDKRGGNGDFYKGLIQLAGAFVHLQKNRPGPAAALFRLTRTHLAPYAPRHEGLNLTDVRLLIECWLLILESGQSARHPLTPGSAPHLLPAAEP